jgi:hypothetical protein
VLRARHLGLSRGKSVQVSVIRGEGSTTLHVDETTDSVVAPLKVLQNYTNQPWVNPEMETLMPQRPLAPPTGYFALSYGGFDPIDFRMKANPVPGYVGCLRGFRVGEVDYLSLLGSATRENNKMVKTLFLINCIIFNTINNIYFNFC